jgi:hypothetical protein
MPPQPGLQYKVSGSKSDWTGKHTTSLTLNFPICAECEQVSREKGGVKAVTWIGALFALGLCLLATIMGGSINNNTFLGLGIGVVVFIACALLIRSLAEAINQKGFTPEQRERRKLVLGSARVLSFKAPGVFDKTGSIVFQFENMAFAAEFSALNGGQLV